MDKNTADLTGEFVKHLDTLNVAINDRGHHPSAACTALIAVVLGHGLRQIALTIASGRSLSVQVK